VNQSKLITACLFLLTMIAAALGLSGCASTQAQKTESLLSAAGFHTMTPSTAQQQACYAALPPFKVQRHDFNGKVVYAYADKKAGTVYVGSEKEYQRYNELAQQQQMADEQVHAAEMNRDAVMNWDYWGPPGVW